MYDNKIIGENPHIEYYRVNNTDMVRIPYEITEIAPGLYSWSTLTVKYTSFNYGGIVDAIIGLKYSSSSMTAVINNYLLDPTDELIKKEFDEMQEYRKYAKNIARSIIETDKK